MIDKELLPVSADMLQRIRELAEMMDELDNLNKKKGDVYMSMSRFVTMFAESAIETIDFEHIFDVATKSEQVRHEFAMQEISALRDKFCKPKPKYHQEVNSAERLARQNLWQLGLCQQRIKLAKDALVATGYFTEDEVGDDIAPRIIELWSKFRK